MVVHYIYAIYFKGKPVYIGISCNPAKRLYLHKSSGGGHKIGAFFNKIKRISDLHLSILDTVKTDSVRKTVECHIAEQRWISKFKGEGHRLYNTVNTFYP